MVSKYCLISEYLRVTELFRSIAVLKKTQKNKTTGKTFSTGELILETLTNPQNTKEDLTKPPALPTGTSMYISYCQFAHRFSPSEGRPSLLSDALRNNNLPVSVGLPRHSHSASSSQEVNRRPTDATRITA